MSARKSEKTPKSFEESLEKLNDIIERMESAELPLDDIIQSYEEGMVYLKFCREKLKAAELKIEKLQPDEGEEGPGDEEENEESKDSIDLF